MMLHSPMTTAGQLQREIAGNKQAIGRKADRHEIDAIRSKLASLERELGEVRAEYSSLLDRVQELGREAIAKAEE